VSASRSVDAARPRHKSHGGQDACGVRQLKVRPQGDRGAARRRRDLDLPNPRRLASTVRLKHRNHLTMVFRNVVEPRRRTASYKCPCCGFRTLFERGGDEICPVCFWQDDGQDDHDADDVRGGPNDDLSLTEARRNYRTFGASTRKMLPHVRAARPDER
jgi:hypothetical protein